MKARTSGVSLVLRHTGAYRKIGPSVMGRKVISRRSREAAAYDPTGDTTLPAAIAVRRSSITFTTAGGFVSRQERLQVCGAWLTGLGPSFRGPASLPFSLYPRPACVANDDQRRKLTVLTIRPAQPDELPALTAYPNGAGRSERRVVRIGCLRKLRESTGQGNGGVVEALVVERL